jgi:hypothetical protein
MAQTKEALRRLRMKFGLGEFSKNRRNKTFKKSRVIRNTMAKRRSTRRSGVKSFGFWGQILGIGGFLAFKAIVEPMLPVSGTALNIAEIIIGAWLAKKSGFVGNLGKAMVTVNIYTLMRAYVAPMLQGGLSVSSPNAYSY